MARLAYRVGVSRVRIHSAVKVNLVFRVPGEAWRPEFTGAQCGANDERESHLMVQAALNETSPDGVDAHLESALLMALDYVAAWSQRHGPALDLSSLRRLSAGLVPLEADYDEGECFVVLLGRGLRALGVVARVSFPLGVLFTCLFAHAGSEAQDLSGTIGLAAGQSSVACLASDLALRAGRWPSLGRLPNWERSERLVEPVVRRDDVEREAVLRQYDDGNLNVVASQAPVDYDTDGYERDEVLGYGVLEDALREVIRLRRAQAR